LGPHVTKLCSDTEEESVLLGKRLLLVGSLGAAGGSLSGHIGIGNLRNGSEEEDNGKDEYEDGNALIRI
jgi:hypothetical protein